LNQSSTDSVDCYLMEEYGSCWGPTDYEHEGNPCCVLHFPSEDKKVAFRTALEAKLKDEDFNFSGAYFPSGMALFGDYATQMERHRRGVRLRTGLRFRTQLEEASFREATFSGEVDFKEVTFHGEADFSGAIFSGEADFGDAVFRSRAYSAYFDTYFHKATFIGGASFGRVTFGNTASFAEATFRGEVSFRGATFKESARFHDFKAFPRTALVFSGANIEKPERISFHTTYLRPSWFVDVDAQKFDFSDVEWFRIPDTSEPDADKLAELTLEEEIENLLRPLIAERQKSLSKFSDNDVLEEDLENLTLVFEPRNAEPEESSNKLADNDVQTLRNQSLRRLTKCCRRLMNNAEENRDYPTANEFHYWSMEAQRKEGWSRLGVIATLYWALSGYGERPLRALGVLFGIWLAFAALYLLLADSAPFWAFSASSFWGLASNVGQAVVYSLGALARLSPEPKPTPGLFQFLVTLEGLLGPLQIALFLLAVRRRVMR
jgi:hypothetical protein